MLRPAFALFFALALAACGGGGSGPEDPGEHDGNWYVDAVNGSDQNDGSYDHPFKSITQALSVAVPGHGSDPEDRGDTVWVSDGVYDASIETFPLVVPEYVRLVTRNTGVNAHILGGGMLDPQDASDLTAAVVLRDGARLGWFSVTNPLTAGAPGFHYGVVIAGDDTDLEQLHVYGSLNGGIRVAKGKVGRIVHCEINNHPNGIGLHLTSGESGGIVHVCHIHANKIGVEYDTVGPTFGGGAAISRANSLHGNLHTDLWINPGVQVDARSNYWDHAPPNITTQSNLGGGVDIFSLGGLSDVQTTGAQVYVP